jgi:23S rRNA pseudouridine1911/1915/1917 synthase
VSSTRHELVVEEADAGTRLDLYVGGKLGLSRARLKALFDEGAVKVNGRAAKKGQAVLAGQTVAVEVVSGDPRPVPEPQAPLVLLHQSADYVFANKPAGWPSHPLQPGETGTLANALVARFPECVDAGLDPREGGLCHRLDGPTSGVIVAARSREAWRRAREAFTGREVDKRYWAVVSGPLADEGEIDLPLRHSARHSDRVEPAADGPDGAREALTTFRVLSRKGQYTLVEARIHTGVLHQVRAHLAGIGAPLVGDSQYGGEILEGLPRHLLHARTLQLPGEPAAHALPPDDFLRTLERLGLQKP